MKGTYKLPAMLYYLIIGLILTLVYQITPAARKHPFKFLEGIPTIWFVLFSIGRGLLLVLTYPILILLFTAAYIHKWITEGYPGFPDKESREIDELVRGYMSIDCIMVDESDKAYFRPDHPPTISSDDGLLKYTFHYY